MIDFSLYSTHRSLNCEINQKYKNLLKQLLTLNEFITVSHKCTRTLILFNRNIRQTNYTNLIHNH